MQIPYFIRSDYGIERSYIAEPVTTQIVATLTGKKTIDARDISALRALGHSLVQVLPPSARKTYGSTVIPLVQPVDFLSLAKDICSNRPTV